MAKDFYSKSNLGFHSMELTKLITIDLLTKLYKKNANILYITNLLYKLVADYFFVTPETIR